MFPGFQVGTADDAGSHFSTTAKIISSTTPETNSGRAMSESPAMSPPVTGSPELRDRVEPSTCVAGAGLVTAWGATAVAAPTDGPGPGLVKVLPSTCGGVLIG